MSSGSIIKREGKNGVSWLLKYDADRDPVTGKRQQRYKTVRGTKKDAQSELRKLLGEVDTGAHIDPAKTTVADWVESWLRDHVAPSVSQATYEGYKQKLTMHVMPRIGRVLVQKLTAPMIQKMYTDLLTSGHRPNMRKVAKSGATASTSTSTSLSAQTVLHVHRTLFQCLKMAARQKVIARNPAEDVTAPNPKRTRNQGTQAEGAADGKALDNEQLPALFGAFKGKPLFALVAVCLGTGLRRGEVLALSWSDIDLEKLTLRVNRAIEVTEKFGVRIKDCPKNDSSRRTLGIDEGTCELLRTHRKEQRELALKLGTSYPADCLLFPCVMVRAKGRQPIAGTVGAEVDFCRPWNPTAITKQFKRIAATAGLPDLTLHDLRHTHATLLLLESVPLHAVAQRLGHSTPVITMMTYAHVLRRAEDQAAQVSGDFLKAAWAV
jgi:integrase